METFLNLCNFLGIQDSVILRLIHEDGMEWRWHNWKLQKYSATLTLGRYQSRDFPQYLRAERRKNGPYCPVTWTAQGGRTVTGDSGGVLLVTSTSTHREPAGAAVPSTVPMTLITWHRVVVLAPWTVSGQMMTVPAAEARVAPSWAFTARAHLIIW